MSSSSTSTSFTVTSLDVQALVVDEGSMIICAFRLEAPPDDYWCLMPEIGGRLLAGLTPRHPQDNPIVAPEASNKQDNPSEEFKNNRPPITSQILHAAGPESAVVEFLIITSVDKPLELVMTSVLGRKVAYLIDNSLLHDFKKRLVEEMEIIQEAG